MTPTRLVSAQTQPLQATPSSRQLGESRTSAGNAQSGNDAQDFSALFTTITTSVEAAASAPAEGALADAEAALLPRPSGNGRAKGLRPEDVLPPELLLTLFPQFAQAPASALPLQATAGQDAVRAVIAAALAGSPLPEPSDDNTADDTGERHNARNACAGRRAKHDALSLCRGARLDRRAGPQRGVAAGSACFDRDGVRRTCRIPAGLDGSSHGHGRPPAGRNIACAQD